MECNFGLNYGTQGNNLPTPDKGLNPLRQVVWRFRLFSPDIAILNYFNRTDGIFIVSMGTLNGEIEKLAVDPNYALTWVQHNIVPFSNVIFSHIVVGNEVIPGPIANFVVPAMINMERAIMGLAKTGTYVTTSVAMTVIGASYPPSAGVFAENSIQVMRGVVEFLENRQYPLFVNVYPYFAYASNPAEIRLDYALFNTTDIVVQDGNLQYSNLFYAMVDSVIWAVEKAGGPNVEIVVSETGWPSAGNGAITTVEHARMYANKMITTLMKSGTPKRPGHPMKTHLFAMYNENLKPEGVERNFGIYRPDLTEVYHVNWPKYTGHCNIGNMLT
ncbi:hypothetical protein MKW94_002098 [Papaver nudicaule]|uniref:Uncharacterized protein n=1 Tax=Papaver nudicaule TaxID=74823 RepID=A0AA42B2A7_PAPNU|nr:hypothetical protein [Papaver nudicaule]